MSRPTSTRREIAPLHVPWLQHEQFPATKQACSSEDGLVTSSKNSLIKIVQELKRGRANMDKQLAQLDTQLLTITDFLDGKGNNMFPPHLIMYVEDTPDVMAPLAGDGRRQGGAGKGAAVAGKFSGIFKIESEPPTPALVEEDLNSDPNAFSDNLELSEDGKDKILAGFGIERLEDIISSGKSNPLDLDDFFKEVR
ncbi:ARP2/3 complex 20 kDa subunit [Phytophthora nicotianae]|uniref:ARP2/3 complex 20 kDa subunit n=1 Tax=Phytophthora nicotianae TaxID=4792 RepID=A0A0W8DH55_PHYNI|nr:ARP2/3 complex 20 kDa subunit [Phytophthora nicotianae]